MTDADKKELEDHLSKQYLLIPKNRVYHLAGGILVGIAAFVGVTYKAVLQALESEVAGRAKKQNIMAIEKSVTEAQQRIAGFEGEAKTAAEWLRSTAVQESNVAKQRIAEVEQAGKETIEKLTATPIDSLQAIGCYEFSNMLLLTKLCSIKMEKTKKWSPLRISVVRSKSRASLRKRAVQAKLRSTTHRFGSPFFASGNLTTINSMPASLAA